MDFLSVIRSAGLLTRAVWPDGLRCDTWVEAGSDVPAFYDPMLAKFIVRAPDRDAALAKLSDALARTDLAGIETNLAWLRQVVADPVLAAAKHSTRYLDAFRYESPAIDVLAAGTQTTVQDWPGRVGHWDVGVPPSGPMDDLAFRLGNRLLGNPTDAAGLELTISGPALRFRGTAWICLTGADMDATLDGAPVPWWQPIEVSAGAELRIGQVTGAGARTYLTVRGGIQVPAYLDSRATFTLGRFGGHGGRTLQVGDVLQLSADDAPPPDAPGMALQAMPIYTDRWQLHVIYGPHGAPDFFTDDDIATFFATDWEVHYNSSRTGVRLIGPKPVWARTDGGEAGLHPSNIHDNAYAIGTVDFTGDMPVILGPDGPSLGGFVCPATLVAADRWKLGQLRPGDRIRFIPIDQAGARALEAAQTTLIETLRVPESARSAKIVAVPPGDPRVLVLDDDAHPTGVVYRPSGDKYLLVEYGPQVLDIRLRFRVHALMLALQANPIPGVLELTPGIRRQRLLG